MKLFCRGMIVFIGLVLLWQLCIMVFHLPDYLLPSPLKVLQVFTQQGQLILTQAEPTIVEAILGLIYGTLIGMLTAILAILFKPLRFWLIPIIVISQAIPTFAIAPLLVVWLGYGEASKVATAAIMIFFPIATTFYDGLQQTPQTWLNVAKTMRASKWQVLRYIKIPAALPSLASGLRVAAALAPAGAVVGEWVGASRGLGFLMLNANARMQIDVMFAALFAITVFTLVLYFIVDISLKKLIWWQT